MTTQTEQIEALKAVARQLHQMVEQAWILIATGAELHEMQNYKRNMDVAFAAYDKALATSAQPSGGGDAVPDYCYDPGKWEWTLTWESRDDLTQELDVREIKEIACLKELPPKYAANVPVTFDDEGDPDECEIQWFDSLAEAQAAIDAARPPAVAAQPATGTADAEDR